MSRIRLTISVAKDLTKSQAVRFILVGLLSFLIEFAIFTILIDYLNIRYTYANLPAMAIAIICNYLLTKWFVFETVKYNAKITFFLFLLFTLIGVALNQFLLWFFVESLIINIKVSKFLAVGAVAIFNFFTKKHIVF